MTLVSPPGIMMIPLELLKQRERQPNGDWLLRAELAEAVHAIIVDYRRFPEQCSVKINEQAQLGETRAEKAAKIATARAIASSIKQRVEEDPNGWRWDQIAILGGTAAGAILVGIIVGFAAGT